MYIQGRVSLKFVVEEYMYMDLAHWHTLLNVKLEENLCFLWRGETGVPREKTVWSRVKNQQTQPTYDPWNEELNTGHVDGRQALPPLRLFCSPETSIPGHQLLADSLNDSLHTL